ncbi:hypothetical protein ACQP3C_28555, partial [Escherichia coli]
DNPCALIKRMNIVKISVLFKAVYRIRKNIPKIHMEPQNTQITKILLRKIKNGDIILPDFKIF